MSNNKCEKCGGLMVMDSSYCNEGVGYHEDYRCIPCGARVDDKITKNKLLPPKIYKLNRGGRRGVRRRVGG
jgi:hypothetical protein